jgi:hypothetical protein
MTPVLIYKKKNPYEEIKIKKEKENRKKKKKKTIKSD